LLRRRRTAQKPLFSTRIRDMAGSKPTIPSHRARHANAGEILDSRSDLMLPTVAPGQTPGALRFDSLALHILSHKGERRRRNVSARKVSELYFDPETHFSKAQPPVRAHSRENRQRTASLDELAEPHYYSKRRETSSTRVFASHISGSGSSE